MGLSDFLELSDDELGERIASLPSYHLVQLNEDTPVPLCGAILSEWTADPYLVDCERCIAEIPDTITSLPGFLGNTEIGEFWPTLGSPCVLWIGNSKRGDYGRIRVDGIDQPAHRWAYALMVDPTDPQSECDHLREYSLEMGHRCGVRECVNPLHVRPISPRRNRTEQDQRTKNSRLHLEGMAHEPEPNDPVELLDGLYCALLSGNGIDDALIALRSRIEADVARRKSRRPKSRPRKRTP